MTSDGMPSLPGALPQARKLIALLEMVNAFRLKAYLAAHQRVVGTENTAVNFEIIYTQVI